MEGGKKKTTKPKTKRKPTAYNLHMKKEMARIKKENPGIDHTKAFKMAASTWKKGSK